MALALLSRGEAEYFYYPPCQTITIPVPNPSQICIFLVAWAIVPPSWSKCELNRLCPLSPISRKKWHGTISPISPIPNR